jgi:hypothetical protein
MTKTDFLNIASDLRRAAYWVATSKNKELVAKVLRETKTNSKLSKMLGINYKIHANRLAEELLIASQKLQRMA